MLMLAQMFVAGSILWWVVIVVVIAAAFAIGRIALKRFGVEIPADVVNVLWILLFAIFIIAVLYALFRFAGMA